MVTPTTGRLELLLRAMRSVAAQVDVKLQHIVVGDDCPHLNDSATASRLARDFPGSLIVARPGFSIVNRGYAPARTAVVRNIGIEEATGTFVAHLDDDNEIEPDHIASLVDVLRTTPDADIAYSWRQLVSPSGQDADLQGRSPWYKAEAASRRFFQDQMAFGIVDRHSNVLRDVPVAPDGRDVFHIDSSELLVRTTVHKLLRFRTAYDDREMRAGLCEDRAFCIDACARGLKFAPSGRPTLRYYLGGYSNR